MSQHVKAALLATKDLGKNERLVAVAIAAHMNKSGYAWPSVATIAEYADCSERTVQRAIAKLISLGRLLVQRVAGIATRVYRIVASAVAGVSSTGPGVTNSGQGVSDSAPGGDSQGDTRRSEGGNEAEKGPGSPPRDARGRLAWWQFKRSRADSRQRPPHLDPERRGAALPPPPGGDRCQKPGHVGQLAGRCIPCRSEALAGGVR